MHKHLSGGLVLLELGLYSIPQESGFCHPQPRCQKCDSPSRNYYHQARAKVSLCIHWASYKKFLLFAWFRKWIVAILSALHTKIIENSGSLSQHSLSKYAVPALVRKITPYWLCPPTRNLFNVSGNINSMHTSSKEDCLSFPICHTRQLDKCYNSSRHRKWTCQCLLKAETQGGSVSQSCESTPSLLSHTEAGA